uniref:Uncharacterized protein n=1 Tax=Arundo donax TaxID=35708 RepID=A0A0A9DPT2_ARUDO
MWYYATESLMMFIKRKKYHISQFSPFLFWQVIPRECFHLAVDCFNEQRKTGGEMQHETKNLEVAGMVHSAC